MFFVNIQAAKKAVCQAVADDSVNFNKLWTDHMAPDQVLLDLWGEIVGSPEAGLLNSHQFSSAFNIQKKSFLSTFLVVSHGECGSRVGGFSAVCK